MDELVLHPTETAQWHALVCEAQDLAKHYLGEELESYLVFLLMRFMQQPRIAATILAIEYLRSMQARRTEQHDKLRDIGDQCLLFSGLFPLRAEKKHVKVSYFVNIGRSAYHQLGGLLPQASAQMYNRLAYDFVHAMDVLNAMRAIDTKQYSISPIDALELWSDTGSQFALRQFQKISNATPVQPDPDASIN